MAKSLVVNTTTSASATNTFMGLAGAGVGDATEINTEYAITHNCQITNLRRYISAGGSGTNTITSNKNADPGNLVASGVGTGAAADTTHVDSLVSGDVYNFALASDGTDPTYRVVSCNVEMTGQTGTFFRAGAATPQTLALASTTRFFPIGGLLQANGTGTEANAQWRIRGYSQLSAFQIRITANARLNDTVAKVRINGADVAASSITISAGATGLFLVTDIAQSIATGDMISIALVTGTGTENLTIGFVGVTLLSSANATECLTCTPNTVTRNASGTPNYIAIGGGVTMTATSPTGLGIIPGFATDVKNLRIRINANTCTSDCTLKLFVNGLDSGFTTTITAATTGWFENTVDKKFINATDEICLEINGGTANSLTVAAVGVTLAVPTPINPSVTTKPRLTGGGVGGGPKRRNDIRPIFSLIEQD